MEKVFLLILSLSLITSGVLIVRRQQAGPEEGFRGWGLIKGNAAVIIGALTFIFGLLLFLCGLII